MRSLSVSMAITLAALAASASAQQALVGGTLIDGTGNAAIEDSVVVVENGTITCAGTQADCPLPSGVRVTDVSGSFVTPGLVDAHVHFAQTGWLDGRPDGLRDRSVLPYADTVQALWDNPGRWHRAYLCSGVTAVFDVGGAPWTVTGEHADGEGRADRAHVRAAGPLITHVSDEVSDHFSYGPLADQPTFLPMETPEQIRADVARVRDMGSDAVKVWFVAPASPDDMDRLNDLMMVAGEAAREVGLPLIVHATELEAAKTALRAGAKMLVHSVTDQPLDQEFLDLLLANDAFYAPTLVVGRNWSLALLSASTGEPAQYRDDDRCVDEDLVQLLANPGIATDAVLARTDGRVTPFGERMESEGRELAMMEQNLRAVRDAGDRIVLATDAGNPLTLHGPSALDELEAMQAAGMTPDEIMQAAGPVAAEALRMGDSIGALRAGMTADLLVLAEDPRNDISAFRSLTHVMRQGVLQRQEELQVR
ncbi:amidohydrolase family protein [Aurantiacibacter hainanensis]|uniref:amidohydrolase family protein n=1 Tax=Aurantiacibacter hainanensis TaxID=3076114 RepID=UPI0030C6690E